MLTIVGGLVIVAIIRVTGEVGVIFNVIGIIIVIEGLTIVIGKDNPTGILEVKGMYMVNDLIMHGEGSLFAADNLTA